MGDILRGKTAVITGASSGLGKMLALDLARKSMNLVLASRNTGALHEIVSQLENSGSNVLVQPTDVTDCAQCKVMIDRAIGEFGQIDYLILNAGISMWIRFDEIVDIAILQKVMDTNYFGAVNCIFPALPYLRENRGAIVAISSAQAVIGVSHHTGYSASKHALKGFLEALEFEVGDEINILNVMPGWIRDTNLRMNAFVGGGTSSRATPKHDNQAVSLQECSDKIISAMRKRRREIYIPSKLKALPWLRVIAPRWMKLLIKRAMNKQSR
ncbi:MAG: SDR family oxidoreductase [Acidobacteriota bacterium]|nr:SDR family oxidoreductase [Acidobacteriota bacterium]